MTYGPNLNSDRGEKIALRIFERVVLRKLYGQVKGESWRIRKIRRYRTFVVANYCKIYEFRPLRWCGHVERTQNHRMSKEFATATMEGRRKEVDHVKMETGG